MSASSRLSSQFLAGGTASEIGKTVEFLKEQGKIEKVLPNYSAFVSDKFIGESS